MTDETITSLAREYAKEIVQDTDSYPELPICLLNEMRKEAAEDFEEKIRFLLRRYCLVEKEAVRKQFHEIKLALGDGGRSEWEDDINMEKEVLLKSLFPEIAKEDEG